MKNKIKICLFTLAAALIFAACETFDNATYKPDYLISVNEIVKYPRASNLEKEIQTITGTKKWINTAPYLFSNNIEKIEAIPNQSDEKFFDLKIKLNYRGKLMFTQLWADILYKDFGFIVNDILYRKLTPDMITRDKDDENVIILQLKLDTVTANAIADASEKNYKYYNPDADKKR